jgi:hypothetical protein
VGGKRHDTLHLLHGRLREIVGGRPRFCFYGAESDASDQKQARIVLILKSGDKGKYWKGGALCGDRVVTKLPTITDTIERVLLRVCEREEPRADVIGVRETLVSSRTQILVVF